MLRMYAAIHREMRDSLQPEEQAEELREQKRRKRIPSEELIKKSKANQQSN
jgi:hypothetical protein